MNLRYYFVGAGNSHFLFSKALIFLMVMFPFLSLAQDDLNKTVQVTKAYDPIISDAEKIEFPGSISDTLLNIKDKYQYSITPQNITSRVTLRPMPAAKISEDAYKDPKWLYARLGVGYPFQVLSDIYLHNLNPADISYGLFYNHRSIWTKINNPNGENIPIDEMNHQAGIFFRKSWEKLSFNIDGGFNGHNVLFYGYNTTTAKRAAIVPAKDSIAQAYTSIYVNVGVNSQDTKESKLRYHANLLFDIFGDNGENRFKKGRMFSMNENTFGGDVMLGYAFGEKKHLISLKADGNIFMRNLDYNGVYNNYFTNPLLIYNDVFTSLYGIHGTGKNISDIKYILNVMPSFSFSLAKIDFDLGVKYTGYKKEYSMKSKIYPAVNVRLKLANEFVPYAGFNGEMQMNDYKSIASENPFISPGMNMAMKATDCFLDISAGVKGNIENLFAYNIYGKYSFLKDFYFFVNSGQTLPASSSGSELVALRNNFDVVYDDVRQLKVGVDLKISAGRVEALLSGAYYSYTLDVLNAAFHRPTFVAGLDIDVKATKSLIFNVNLHANSKTPYTYNVAHSEIYYNEMFVNLGAGVEYLFNRSFSIFFNVNNLLNRRNEIWHGYKLPGFGILGGITFKF
ncbi:MAG: hypothetical protein LBD76_00970 [Prevotellaceae bacterium]|jgi:hypothetical protein|nr:hypothetical protein [Prevotellaceae bacterium]